MPYSFLKVYVSGEHYLIDRVGTPSPAAKNDERVLVCQRNNIDSLIYSGLTERRYKGGITEKFTYSPNGLIFADYYGNQSFKISSNGISSFFELNLNEQQALSDKEMDKLFKQGDILSEEIAKKGRIWG